MGTPPSRRRTILFVDVVASTELYEALGDVGARTRIAPCLDEFAALIQDHGGTLVKSLGDGILAAFDAEPAAVDTALAMVGGAARHGLQVSIGIQAGEVLVEEDDVFGQAVNVASRLSGLARPAEILVTRDVIGRLSPALRSSARRLQNVAVKGVREPMELFALSAEVPTAPMTVSGSMPGSAELLGAGLEIRLGTRAWRVPRDGRLTLGRDPASDVVVHGDLASRRHAVVTSRQEKYVLADQSVNGTWLLPDDGTRIHLLREEGTLHGSGTILLGVPPEPPPAEPIGYRTLG